MHDYLTSNKKVELCLFIRVEAVSFIVFARTFKNNLKNIKGIYIRNTIRNMRGLQDRIQFHPQRPSRSKSRTKFSPYQMHHSNDKHITQARQNRDKLTLKEPIIKIKELISATTSHKHKLTLNTEKPYPEPSLLAATNFSNCNFHSPFQTIQNSKFVDLVNKIDQQSNVIEQYFTELNRKLKLPKLEVSEQQKYERQTQKQNETQLLILQQLKSLKNISNQNMHLRQIIARYEKESQYYRQEIQKWQQQAHILLQKVSNLEKAIIVLQQEKKKNQNSINSIESKCFMKGSKESITKEDEIEVKLAESEKQTKNQLAFIESLQKEIQNLKLQNQMLSEQVKLLNYSLNQREKQFEMLKRKNSMAKEPTQKKSLSRKSSIASQIPAVQSNLVNEFDPKPTQSCKLIETSKLIQQDQKEIEAEEMEKNRALQISMRRKSKNTRSLLIKSNGQIDRGLLNSRMSQLVSSGKGCSIDQQILSDKVLKALHIFQSPNMKKSTSQSRYKVNAQIDKRKLNFVKSILKIGAKSNMRETKVAGKREGKEISNFTPAKLADLQIIRKTIGARWRVLRVRFSAIQQQLLDHKSSTITQKQIAQYLEIYPFFLNVQLIEEILRYIFRKDYEQQEESETWPSVELDFFCNCLREFIPEDTPFEQEEEALMLQKIKAVVCQNTLSLLEQLWYEQSEAGVIRQAQMRTVLQQFKFSVPEIQLMIGQCCLISLDIEHLSYEKYISFFNQS